MRILDEVSNKSLESVVLYLTNSEASELRDSLTDLLQAPMQNHAHVSDESFKKEITVCIYDLNHLSGFDARSIDLIVEDK